MMKKMKKILMLIFSMMIALSMCFSLGACNAKPEKEPDKEIENIKQTEFDLVKDETSAYKIVLPEKSLYNERFACEEIRNFFEQATKIKLNIVTDAEVTYSKDAKLIIVGNNKFISESGIDKAKVLQQGFQIKTVGSNLFIVGGDELGTLYGAYEFLHLNLGFEVYATDEISLKKGIKNLKLYDLDMTDSPDILWRTPNYGSINSALASSRFRMTRNPWIMEQGNFVHNSIDEYFPVRSYKEKHPNWYSVAGSQLCYSARGDNAELALMRDRVVERMKELVTKFYSTGNFLESISFTHEDVPHWCTCKKCIKYYEDYGTNAAVLIHFINPVAKTMKAWMNETYPGHKLNIAIFAYQPTEKAPAKKVGDIYVPIDDTVILEDNVAIFYAPFNADYYHDFDAAKNTQYKETLDKWSALSKNLYLWTYSTNFEDYLAWFDTFDSMQPIYKMAKKYNSNFIFDQGRYNTSGMTGFDSLKVYLNSKLAWNVDANYSKLIEDFFSNYFQEAAKPMRAYFESYRTWMEYLKQNTEISGRCNVILNAKHWPKQILLQWNDYIEQAHAAIEPIKEDDLDKYNKLEKRILSESIAIRYHLIEFYGNSYGKVELKDMQRSFKKDAEMLGFTKFKENLSLQDAAFTKWGL